MKTDAVIAAERACDIADARLGVIEEARWVIAVLLSACVYLRWDTWLGAILIFWIPIFLLPYGYSKDSDAAHDSLDRMEGTGKYSKAVQPRESSE
jgi:hypothetical protein